MKKILLLICFLLVAGTAQAYEFKGIYFDVPQGFEIEEKIIDGKQSVILSNDYGSVVIAVDDHGRSRSDITTRDMIEFIRNKYGSDFIDGDTFKTDHGLFWAYYSYKEGGLAYFNFYGLNGQYGYSVRCVTKLDNSYIEKIYNQLWIIPKSIRVL